MSEQDPGQPEETAVPSVAVQAGLASASAAVPVPDTEADPEGED